MIKRWWALAPAAYSILVSLISLATFRKFSQEVRQVDQQLNRCLAQSTNCKQPFVSVLVPARNEEENIAECLRSILNQNYPNFEIIAIDDNSTDRTPAILNKLAASQEAQGRLRVFEVKAVPPNWLGKNNALWQGQQQANPQAEWFLFVDADTRLEPGTLRGTVTYARSQKLGLLSLSPGLHLGSFWHRLLLAEIAKFYSFALLDRFGLPRPGSVEEASANGAFMLVCKEAYLAAGGHEAVKNQVLEDVELARNFRRAGYGTYSSYSSRYIAQRPNGGLLAFWESMSKNWFLVARRRWSIAFLIVLFELSYGLLPLVLLLVSFLKKKPGGKQGHPARWLNLLAVGLTVGLYGEMLQIYKAPRTYGLLYHLAALIDLLIILSSAIKISFFRSVAWKDRIIVVDGE